MWKVLKTHWMVHERLAGTWIGCEHHMFISSPTLIIKASTMIVLIEMNSKWFLLGLFWKQLAWTDSLPVPRWWQIVSEVLSPGKPENTRIWWCRGKWPQQWPPEAYFKNSLNGKKAKVLPACHTQSSKLHQSQTAQQGSLKRPWIRICRPQTRKTRDRQSTHELLDCQGSQPQLLRALRRQLQQPAALQCLPHWSRGRSQG